MLIYSLLCDIIALQLYKLIKSGGGTGPMKPGNLYYPYKVPNPDR